MNKNISVLSIAIAIIIFLRCIFDGNDNIKQYNRQNKEK